MRDEVRGGVETRPAREPRPFAVGPEEGLGKRACAALPLRTRNMDNVKLVNFGSLEKSA